jgi:hypothetical protein
MSTVIAGLDPAIHPFREKMDHRIWNSHADMRRCAPFRRVRA